MPEGGIDASVAVERDGPVARVVYASELDRLSGRGLALLRRAVDGLIYDPAVRVIVLCGPPERFPRLMDPDEGGRIAALAPPLPGWLVSPVVRAAAAVLGAVPPLRRILDLRILERRGAMFNLLALTGALERCDKITVAAIDGPAFGGGLEIALACDLRVASDRAHVYLAQPEILGGVMAGFGATQRLPRLIGAGRALELLLVGEALRPEVALSWGLLTRVFPAETFARDVSALAARLARRSPEAVAGTKAAVRSGDGRPIEAGLSAELRAVLRVWRSPEARLGLAAIAAQIEEERHRTTLRPLPELLAAVEERPLG